MPSADRKALVSDKSLNTKSGPAAQLRHRILACSNGDCAGQDLLAAFHVAWGVPITRPFLGQTLSRSPRTPLQRHRRQLVAVETSICKRTIGKTFPDADTLKLHLAPGTDVASEEPL